MTKLKDFYYELPKELIAQEPLKKRDMARLMVLDRAKRSIREHLFRDITAYFERGDCLVMNDTRVIPARLYGRRKSGGRVEIFLLDPDTDMPRALVRPSKRIKDGEEIELEGGIKATVMGREDVGRRVRFDSPIREVLSTGHVPLPPYIDRIDSPADRDDYQTVYARREGATASPTAGLHFTEDLLSSIEEKGVRTVYVTLHTSYGTFSPVTSEDIEEHNMHEEFYQMSAEAASAVNDTKSGGGRVFAVGTTSTRVLETCGGGDGRVSAAESKSNLFIYPGYKFRIVDGIITNFHLPESTLLMLVSAFAGRDFILEAYQKAINDKFRFFSYGDAMIIF
jgi:S-adenosylmethionine:tRNA ribosyltransferase-isomerase